jgi:hypothetical protein
VISIFLGAGGEFFHCGDQKEKEKEKEKEKRKKIN